MKNKERIEWLEQESKRQIRAGWQSALARRNAQEALKAKYEAGEAPIRDCIPRINPEKEERAMEGVRYE